MTDWKKFIYEIAIKKEKVKFFNPASEEELECIESILGIPVPESLAELLRQTNGVGGGLHGMEYTIGYCEEIIEYNQEHRAWLRENEITPPGKYFLFGEDGMGDYFGFDVTDGVAPSEEIGAYCPIENEFKFVAKDLREWAIGCYSGDLTY